MAYFDFIYDQAEKYFYLFTETAMGVSKDTQQQQGLEYATAVMK